MIGDEFDAELGKGGVLARPQAPKHAHAESTVHDEKAHQRHGTGEITDTRLA